MTTPRRPNFAWSAARRYGWEGYEKFPDISHRWGIATSLSRIGFAELGLGNLVAAAEVFHQGLNLALAFKYRHTGIYALIGLAGVQARQGDEPGAIELLVVAISDPITPAQYRIIGQMELDNIQDCIPADVFAAARELGEQIGFDEVIARVRKPEITGSDTRVTGLKI